MVERSQRFRRENPCRICGGYDQMPRGKRVRCSGFLSSDGRYAHCTREEYAGDLKLSPSSQAYCHALRGDCGCGRRHGPIPPVTFLPPRPASKRAADVVYDYVSGEGQLLFQLVRRSGEKRFSLRRPDPERPGKWIWNLDGVEPVLYRLHELLQTPQEQIVFVVEGEKDADALWNIGLVATTNPMGAGKWSSEYSKDLAGRPVVAIADNDDDGRRHVQQVAGDTAPSAASLKVIDPLPGVGKGGDVADWLANGGTAQKLLTLAAHAPDWDDSRSDAFKEGFRPTDFASVLRLRSAGRCQRSRRG